MLPPGGQGRMSPGEGLTGSGIRQEFRFFRGNIALPKVLATSATLIPAAFGAGSIAASTLIFAI